MRILSWFLSILLHTAVLAVAVWAAQAPPRMIDLGVPVYHVDLVRLAKGSPAKAAPKAAPAPRPAPKAVPVAKPEPEPEPVAKPEPKPEPVAKPEAKPEPKPEAKPVAAKEKEPPKKAEEPKKKPAPKKPEPSREDVLKQALARAQRDVKWKERQQRKAVEQELADLRQSVAQADAAAENATQSGDGGDDAITAAYGLADIYSVQVVAAIRPNWRFPSLPGTEDLMARVRIRIAPDGTIREYMITAPSGRPEFDASVLKAVEETVQLPAPPRPDLEYIDVNFNLSELQQ